MEKMEKYIDGLSKYQKPNLQNVKELTSAEHYYDPHTHMSTHESLVNDQMVLSTYRLWIEDNERFIKNKVVLDVSCGIGILSMLAAKAGAKRVIGVEWSHIAEQAKEVVAANGLEKVVTIIKAPIEEAVLPQGFEEVDTIISMWPGYCLFVGGRLKKVLYARDKWLKPNGVILPDQAALYITAIADVEYKENCIDNWNYAYGYDLSAAVDEALSKGVITDLDPEKMVTNICCVKNINLRTDSYEDVTKEVPFSLTATKNDFVQGYATFFNVSFSLDLKNRKIETDPRSALTHWRHTCFYLKDYFAIRKKEKIRGSFSLFGINNDPRFLGVIIGTMFSGVMDEVIILKTYTLRN